MTQAGEGWNTEVSDRLECFDLSEIVYPERMRLADVWPHFEADGLVNLATIDGNQPPVRVMALNVCDDDPWLVTRSGNDKIDQIRKNS